MCVLYYILQTRVIYYILHMCAVTHEIYFLQKEMMHTESLQVDIQLNCRKKIFEERKSHNAGQGGPRYIYKTT
jgi:hypothetical protein